MLNYYQLLDLPDFAAPGQVKKAYRARCRQYHPDAVSALGPKLVALAESEMAVINLAYEQLGNPESKAEFDAWLERVLSDKAFRNCARCGLQFTPEQGQDMYPLCPPCRSFSDKLKHAAAAAPGPHRGQRPQNVLGACFVVVHHFMSASVVRRFHPTVECLVNGEKFSVSGFPGDISLVLSNRKVYDAVHADGATRKHAWNTAANAGKITFAGSHPLAAADTVWSFMSRALGSTRLDFCRICIHNDHFRPYELVLNQTAVAVAAGLSPWIAAKLYSRHGRNVAAAAADHEAALPDPFYNVLAALGPDSDPARAGGLADRAHALEQRVHELGQKLLLTDNERDTARQQALGLSQMVEDLRNGMSVLETENERIPWLQSQVIDLASKLEHARTQSGAGAEWQQEIKIMRRFNAWLQEQAGRIPALDQRILDLEKRNQALASELAHLEQFRDGIDKIRDAVAHTIAEHLDARPAPPDMSEIIPDLIKTKKSAAPNNGAQRKATARPSAAGTRPPSSLNKKKT